MIFIWTAFVAAIPQPKQVDARLVSLFRSRCLEVAASSGRVERIPYRLFEPRMASNGKRPLIVWLHGLGESGSDNVHQLRWLDHLIFRSAREASQCDFYLLAVQCPEGIPWFNPRRSPDRECPEDMLDVVIHITERLRGELPIDEERISLAGLSSGGTACWELFSRRPHFFAAVAPMGSSVAESTRLPASSASSLWAFHSGRELQPSPTAARNAVVALRQTGQNARFTEIDGSHHECWMDAFEKHDLLRWLLRQQRGEREFPVTEYAHAVHFRLGRAFEGWDVVSLLRQAWTLLLLLVVVAAVFKHRRRARAQQGE